MTRFWVWLTRRQSIGAPAEPDRLRHRDQLMTIAAPAWVAILR